MFRYSQACLRSPGPEIVHGLTQHQHDEEGTPSCRPCPQLANEQHVNYQKALMMAGLHVTVRPSDPQFPDGCFTEDTHLVLPEIVVRLNPGALSRSAEPDSLRPYLPQDRPYNKIPLQWTIDGGDILVLDKTVYVGESARTQKQGITFLQNLLSPFNYQVVPLLVPQGLHLKSGATCLSPDYLILQRPFSHIDSFIQNRKFFIVPKEESLAANILPINNCVLVPPHCPRTKEFIQSVVPEKMILEVDTSEFAKVDGALTCLSLLW